MVSVIIPTYNSGKFIINSVESVLSQSYNEIECIVIDDGSTDDTLRLLTPLIDSHSIIYYYQENKGVSAARNLGIEKSSGDYLLFLDADDLLNPTAIEKLRNQIHNKDIIFGAWQDFGEYSINRFYYTFEKNNLATFLRNKPTVSTALIKRKVLQHWNELLKVWEVTDYFLGILLTGAEPLFIDEVVTEIRQHTTPSRASIIEGHFDPLTTLFFFKSWKQKIISNDLLDAQTETILDENIINNIYSAITLKTEKIKLIPYFKEINFKLIRNSKFFKPFGLYYFIFHFNSINIMFFFNKINKYFGR